MDSLAFLFTTAQSVTYFGNLQGKSTLLISYMSHTDIKLFLLV